MRKLKAAAHLPADRIVLRAEGDPAARPSYAARRPVRREIDVSNEAATPADQSTMDYQMGFTSGPSN